MAIAIKREIRIEKHAVIKRSMDIAVTVHAGVLCPDPTMLDPVFGWNAVALVAVAVPALIQQTVVRRTVRLMTLDATSSFDKMSIDDRVLI